MGEDKCERLDPVTVKQAAEELNETSKTRKNALKELRHWLKAQRHLQNVRTDHSFLVRFLRFQKFNLESTKTVFDKYIHMRQHHSEWFQNLDIQEPKMRDIMSSGYLIVLPERDANGRRVIFSRACSVDVSKFTACDIMRAHILTYEALLTDEETQVKGITYVFDERNINLSHISIWSPSDISKAFSCCEKAMPIRHQEIHFVHLPWTMSLVFAFGKSLLSKKLSERFQTHSNFEKLSKEFDSSILPEGYGGTVSLEDMTNSWIQELEDCREEILDLDRMKYGLKKGSEAKRKTSVNSAQKKNKPENSGILNMVKSVRKMENRTSESA
ncbi:hypothetical protein TCAL_03680 [Tigriopus californicus]|uniref:CRAL-TRIO domain-containing protein n=1 Tax=Tigriopus californicus TaxID=6832 RepID=A0A553N6Z9_TIGCA|nr:retinaldehyde-binding protein 1-like [Tigriopus californicus]TRY61207.1 hypothetical protein TCAL_03680 [Tigriopus californicus]|eukprot:TCALIF_03680-PA protein Name:"Similar to clvs2 Clavesin-2 (Danio rerio)" AED:0.02 eAED:0.02 QI:0/-1/0/1/-1/1/1/0/327